MFEDEPFAIFYSDMDSFCPLIDSILQEFCHVEPRVRESLLKVPQGSLSPRVFIKLAIPIIEIRIDAFMLAPWHRLGLIPARLILRT